MGKSKGKSKVEVKQKHRESIGKVKDERGFTHREQ